MSHFKDGLVYPYKDFLGRRPPAPQPALKETRLVVTMVTQPHPLLSARCSSSWQ